MAKIKSAPLIKRTADTESSTTVGNYMEH